jgi:hypothetical protein
MDLARKETKDFIDGKEACYYIRADQPIWESPKAVTGSNEELVMCGSQSNDQS